MCHKYIFFLKTDVNCPLFWILKMELFVFYEWRGEEKQERWFWFVGRHHDIKEDEALYKGALKSSKNVVIDNNATQSQQSLNDLWESSEQVPLIGYIQYCVVACILTGLEL